MWETIAVLVGSGSLMLALSTIVLTVSVFFRKIEEVERRIATPGKQLDGVRRVWGNGFAGRWFRAGHVWMFFAFRNIPGFGSRLEHRMGDETEPVPVSLKLWAVVPVTIFFSLTTLFICSAWFLGLF